MKRALGPAIAALCVAASVTPIAAKPMLSPKVMASAEPTQHSWKGRNYCWSEAGWRGPGWYRCGFSFRRGKGWGGRDGWHGWTRETHSNVRGRHRSGAAFESTSRPRELQAPLGNSTSSRILNSPLTRPGALRDSASGSGGLSNGRASGGGLNPLNGPPSGSGQTTGTGANSNLGSSTPTVGTSSGRTTGSGIGASPGSTGMGPGGSAPGAGGSASGSGGSSGGL
jgi:hypothetical protein